MLDRRSFFVVPLIAVVPSVPPAPLPPREFHRYVRPLDRWERIRPSEIRTGDVLRVFDPPDGTDDTVIVSRVEPEQFYAAYKLDRKTNQWGPVT